MLMFQQKKVSVNNPANETQDTKLLVIEINPVLKTITNKKLYSFNYGYLKVSKYFN